MNYTRYQTDHTLERAILVLAVLMSLITIFMSLYAVHKTADVEILNGSVISKYHQKVSCEHSYQCNCTTDSKGNVSCQTCYKHNHDVSWTVKSNFGEIDIKRVDDQGLIEPPRFKQVLVGEPFAKEHRFTNYILGSKDSLFNEQENQTLLEEYKTLLPNYPNNVFDYYRSIHFVTVGAVVPAAEAHKWNRILAEYLRILGPKKQVNTIVVVTNQESPRFAQALWAHWVGGKKNDVITVVGTKQYPKIDWVSVLSWSDEEMLKVKLRDALLDSEQLNPMVTPKIIADNVNAFFVRKPMKSFEYLSSIDSTEYSLLAMSIVLWLVFGYMKLRSN